MKTTRYSLLALVLLLATSCTVDVPDTDHIPPKFSFSINGDGFNHTFTEADNLSNMILHLKKGATYKFIFIGSDAGGLQNLLWNYQDDLISHAVIDITDGLAEGWYKTTHYEHDFEFYPFVDGIRFQGDPADPLSGAAVSGTFSFDSFSQETFPNAFDFIARDYGGLSGDPNLRTQHLDILLSDHPTELVPVD